MLELKWADINKTGFIGAMMTLNNNNELDRITAYRVGRIVDVCRRELKKAHDKELVLATEFAELDASGKPVMVEVQGGKRPKVHADNSAKMDEAMDKLFEENTVQIKVHKLDFNALSGLTGEQIIAIEAIVENLPKEE